MFNLLKKSGVVGSLILVAGCAGPVGPQGPQGEAGPPGPGFEGAPSVSMVNPTWVVVGRSQTVQVSGFDTAWTSAAQVNFGNGVTVARVQAASKTALLVDLTVSGSATPGKRDISITEGGQTVTYTGVFEVKPVVEHQVLGKAAQVSASLIRVISNDADFALPTSSLDISVIAPTGVSVTRHVTSTTRKLDLLVRMDLNAPPGAAEIAVKLFEGKGNEYAFSANLNIASAAPVTLTEGTPANGNIATPFDSVTYKFTAPAANTFVTTVTSANPEAKPRFALLDSTGAFANSVFQTGADIEATAAAEEYYVVVWDDSGASGAFTLNARPYAAATEAEPNDTTTNAQVIAALPVKVTGGTLPADTDVDFFKVTVDASAVGKKFRVITSGPSATVADNIVDVLASDGTTSLGGPSPDSTITENFLSSAISAAGDYYIKVYSDPGYWSALYPDYAVSIRLE